MGKSAWIISDEMSMNMLTRPRAHTPRGISRQEALMAGVATVIRRSEITVLALNLEEEQWSPALARMFMLVKPSGLDCCCFPTLVDLASASFVEHCPIKRIKPVRAAKMSGASRSCSSFEVSATPVRDLTPDLFIGWRVLRWVTPSLVISVVIRKRRGDGGNSSKANRCGAR